MNTDSHGLNTDLHGCDIERLLARSTLYQALSILFRHPRLSLSVPRSAWDCWRGAVEVVDGSLSQPLNSLIFQIETVNHQDWIHHYETCFGHTAKGTVPIYELEYGEEHSFREPRQLADITAFYRAFGLKINQASHERADHAAVECEFMHFLIYKAAYALEHDGEEKFSLCYDASHRFLSDHLGRWLPAFCWRLSKYASGGILKQIGEFVLAFVMEDCQRLGIEAGSPSLPIRKIQNEKEPACGSCPLG